MDINTSQELRTLGFSDNEVKVYIALLKLREAKAGAISRECYLERSSTYNALKKLMEKGIVSRVIESNRQVFAPADPTRIIDYFKEQQEKASLLLPQLSKLKLQEQEKENITKFRGYNGVKNVVNDVLHVCKPNEEYLIMGSENQLSDRLPVFAKIFVARKDAMKLRARILVRKGRKGLTMSKYTKVRYMPDDVVSPAVTSIYGDKVSIILWSKNPEAIIIDNPEAAKTYRSYFEFMWKNAER